MCKRLFTECTSNFRVLEGNDGHILTSSPLLVVQMEPEFRPPISEVVQSLLRLVQRPSLSKRGMDDYDY